MLEETVDFAFMDACTVLRILRNDARGIFRKKKSNMSHARNINFGSVCRDCTHPSANGITG